MLNSSSSEFFKRVITTVDLRNKKKEEELAEVKKEAQRIVSDAEKKAQQILSDAEKKAAEIVSAADFYKDSVIREYTRKKAKVSAWLDHLKKTEEGSRRSREIVKDTAKHVHRILAELKLAKKSERDLSLRSIRKSCNRILRLDKDTDPIN